MISEHAAKFDRKIAIRNGIETVRRNAVKSKFGGDRFAIYRKARSGEGSRAERQNIGPLSGISQTFAVTLEHFKIRQAPMRPHHRLRFWRCV